MNMKTRRHFLAVSAAGLAAPRAFSQDAAPSKRLRVAVMGLGRGLAHISAWLKVPNVEIVAVCDVDRRRIDEGLRAAEKGGQKTKPLTGLDFRKFLEGDTIDVLSVAACNFWHTPAALLAVQAGKHVYVKNLVVTPRMRARCWPPLRKSTGVTSSRARSAAVCRPCARPCSG